MSAQVFEKSSVPPLDGSTDFSFDLWDTIRDRGIEPQFRSDYAADEQGRREFLEGARMMGFELVDLDDADELARLDAMEPQRFPLQPQQLQLSDILDSRHRTYVVEMPRRASKSTTIFLKLLGRCIMRRNYLVTFSAQNGVASGRLFDDWIERLNELWPEDKSVPPWLRDQTPKPRKVSRHVALFGEELLPDEMLDELDAHAAPRPFKARVSPSARDLTIKATGSKMRVIKTAASAYRGLAADVSWLDEAQEIDPEEGGKIIAGIRPLQDTRAARGGSPATIVSGTAGDGRVGVFWSYVNRLRSADASMGGIDFCAPEDTPWDVVENEDAAMDLLCRVHPGVGTLTTRAIMLDTYREPEFGLPQWSREYLSLWPETFGTIAIDPGQWSEAGLASKVTRPQKVAFGMAIKPGGSVAAVCAAWRDARGVAYIEVVQHRPGTRWMVFKKNSGVPDASSGWLQYLTRKYRGTAIAYDRMGEGEATATEAARLRPPPKLTVQSFRDTSAGCVQLLRDLERGTLRHFNQVGLNSAVAYAAKREIRGEATGVFLWTPAEPGADITTLDAATRALRNWDQHFGRSSSTAANRSVMGD